MLSSFLIFILFTAIFFFVISYKTNESKCNPTGDICCDGNGKHQYKGRGYRDEPIDVLMSRIDWLIKNSINNGLYTTSYIIAFSITLAVFLIVYAFTSLIIPVWAIIIVLFASFIICFSVMNLFDFHTNRYSDYYIRNNLNYIAKRLNIKMKEAPNPYFKSKIPFRTKIQDVLSK